MRMLLTFVFILSLWGGIRAQKIYTINTVDDVNDGACDFLHCSLREAILAANADGTGSILRFQMNGSGTKTIRLEANLPAITDANLTIDGNTLPDNVPTKGRLVLDANGKATIGFNIQANDVRIYGFVIQNFADHAILVKNEDAAAIRRVIVGRRRQGNIIIKNGNALYAENIDRLWFKSNFVGTNLTFDDNLGNQNGIIVNNDLASYKDVEIEIGGRLVDEARNYFVNCAEAAIDLSYHGSAKIEGNVFGTDATGKKRMGNKIAIKSSSGRGRIDIGGSERTKNIFAYNDQAVLIDKNNYASVSENSFYCNGLSLSVIQNAYPTPVIEEFTPTLVIGSAKPNDFVELYINDAPQGCNSADCQGMTFLGMTRANQIGKWAVAGEYEYGQEVVALARLDGRQSMFSECLTLCPRDLNILADNTGPYCEGDSIRLSSENNFSKFQWASHLTGLEKTYNWHGPNEYISNKEHPKNATLPGQYIVQAFFNKCPTNFDTTEIEINKISVSLPDEVNHCQAEQIRLESQVTSNNRALSYLWTGPNDYSSTRANPTDVKDAGIYSLVVSADDCQADKVQVKVNNHFPTPLNLDPNKYVCEGETASLTVEDYEHYFWESDIALSCDTCATVYFTPQKHATIRVSAGPVPNCVVSQDINIAIAEAVEKREGALLCPNASLNLFGQEVTEPGIYQATFLGANGCDSTHIYEVSLAQENRVFEKRTICAGESFVAFGNAYTKSGVYQAQFTGRNGCDSTHIIELAVLDNIEIKEHITICEDETVAAFGIDVKNAGVYSKVFAAQNGCDSTHIIHVEVLKKEETAVYHSICAGESMIIFDKVETKAGSYQQTFLAANGCDSTHTIHLAVNEPTSTSEQIRICAEESVQLFGDMTVNESGLYQRQFTAANGCDSIHAIEVTVLAPIQTTEIQTLCEEEAITLFGADNTFPAFHRQVFTSQHGCDSTHTTEYEIQQKIEVEEYLTICENEVFFFDGNQLDQSGKYTASFSATNQCDSSHTIHLTILENDSTNQIFQICEGEQLNVFGTVIQEQGSYSKLFQNRNGCDSTHTIKVVLLEKKESYEDRIICEGDVIQVFDKIINETEQLSKIFRGSNGCDSIHTIWVTKLDAKQNSETVAFCRGDSSLVFGEYVHTSGQFSKTYTANNGCDSTHIIYTEVLETAYTESSLQLCESECIDRFGASICATGVLVENFASFTTCDSIHRTIIELIPMINNTVEHTLCAGDSLVIFGKYYKEAGTYSQSFISSKGCDSMMTVILKYTEPIMVSKELKASCSEFSNGHAKIEIEGGMAPYKVTWDGNPLSDYTTISNLAAGNYEYTITDFLNCEVVQNIQIEAIAKPDVALEIQEISCYGANDGGIFVYGDAELKYRINDNSYDTKVDFMDLSPAQYELYYIDPFGCEYKETIDIQEPVELQIELPEEVTIDLGTTVALIPEITSDKNYTLEWTTDSTLSCHDCKEPIASPIIDKKYTLTIIDDNNCESQDEIWVRVELNSDIYVPNVFSPNDDGHNDFFTILSSDAPIEEVQYFRVFDRWGNQLFEANHFMPNDDNYGWDGRHKGQKMGDGVYVYFALIKFKDGTEKFIEGDITLMK